MKATPEEKRRDQIIAKLGDLAKSQEDRVLLAQVITALDAKYDLYQKAAREPGVEGIITQMLGRIGNAFGRFSNVKGKRILDIACGSNTSKAPTSLRIPTPFGKIEIGRATSGYTAQFEPWFCRILLELGAHPVGVDLGDLEREAFEHYRVDLGQRGALGFLPGHSFAAVQDSRLFGSPEFTFQFPHSADRSDVAQEIRRQERRLLRPDGILIHSDAEELLR
ncbi:MAG: hypothetical protein ABSF61_09240 [Anaerolineales bacterium]|jgi:hypothetical protein